ncbi:hypothetical protein LOTGIDRAFT_238709 [Lottia gigantea]|uniref:G-protein coupled receptors family 2 profile 2 domain-containing protein n=1 Tax=Lottia gigantea TaxID=225164 RepID=V4B0Q8_LOTGI|nr:hypothetical protein LOTGIDRAFT_238709 [Lottia gigantea]ESO99811.1 hypothetical protein LOTGIDRAFT_238709 [Lottia gigantea]
MALVSTMLLLLLLKSAHCIKQKPTNVKEQYVVLYNAGVKCYEKLNSTKKPDDGLYCDMVFDGVMCWDYTPAGQSAVQSCPSYVSGFNTRASAKRKCLETGEWYVNPQYNQTWTDMLSCKRFLMEIHLPKISLLARIGYSISIVFLLLAIAIMIYFKKLHCQRNTIHVNLFLSCLLRAVLCLLKEFTIVKGIGFEMDIEYDANGKVNFKEEGTHWQCKLFYTMFHYTLCTNYMWVLVEGLYLHNLIFFTVFSIRKLYLILYIILGWCSSILIVLPWVFVRATKEDTLCWNTHYTFYYWIIRGPIIASICINFFFFINIIRVLFTKLMGSITREPTRYRKLAKSTLVLIPLFGVQYIVFVPLTAEMEHMEPEMELTIIYIEMFLNSFQGTIVGLLFCFLNGEVRTEIKKFWYNKVMVKRASSYSRPTSKNFHTSSSFIGRDRGSEVNQNMVAMVEINARVKGPSFNGDVKNKTVDFNLKENGNVRNHVTENSSLVLGENQGQQLPHSNGKGGPQSVSPEGMSLLSEESMYRDCYRDI